MNPDVFEIVHKIEHELSRLKVALTCESSNVVDSVANEFGVSSRALYSRLRTKHVAEARHAVFGLLQEKTGKPLDDIARMIGRRDHGTAANSINRYTDLMQTDKSYAAKVARLRHTLGISNGNVPMTNKQAGQLGAGLVSGPEHSPYL